MVRTGPIGPIDGYGRSIVEVPADLTDEDLAWLREHSLGLRIERAWPIVELQPDPRLIQIVLR